MGRNDNSRGDEIEFCPVLVLVSNLASKEILVGATPEILFMLGITGVWPR